MAVVAAGWRAAAAQRDCGGVGAGGDAVRDRVGVWAISSTRSLRDPRSPAIMVMTVSAIHTSSTGAALDEIVQVAHQGSLADVWQKPCRGQDRTNKVMRLGEVDTAKSWPSNREPHV